MNTIAIIMILFAAMVLLPIFGSILHYKRKKSDVLFINQDKTRDPRYFGKSFGAMIRKNLYSVQDGKIQLSREEEYLDGDEMTDFGTAMEKLVIAKADFTAPKGTEFQKEVYCGSNVQLGEETYARAVYSEKDMIVKNNTNIVRWLDAEGTIAAYDGCDLGISITSKNRVSIGKDCTFRRIFAPEICLGQYPDAIGEPVVGTGMKFYPVGNKDQQIKKIKHVDQDLVNEDGFVDYTVHSHDNLIVMENIIVRGDLRSHKGVRVCEGAFVSGNIFAETQVVLEKGACVMGNIFSQGDVYLSQGATVGKKDAVISIIARDQIEVEAGCFVYGYINCEKGGKVLNINEEASYSGAYSYLAHLPAQTKLEFASLAEYEEVDPQGYRHYVDLEEVIIPEGAKIVPESMFFGCTSLRKVVMPKSVVELGAYAFAGCTNLQNVEIANDHQLQKIGVECFLDCKKLPANQIPKVYRGVAIDE